MNQKKRPEERLKAIEDSIKEIVRNINTRIVDTNYNVKVQHKEVSVLSELHKQEAQKIAAMQDKIVHLEIEIKDVYAYYGVRE